MAGRQTTWAPIETHPTDHGHYILLCDKNYPRRDGNMEVGVWAGNCFWSTGGPNGGTEISYHRCDTVEGIDEKFVALAGHMDSFTHWMDLPDDPP